MTRPHATQRPTPTPRPPTAAERAAAASWRDQPIRADSATGVVLLVVVGLLLLGGAYAAYVTANQSVTLDNPFMSGDQSHAANFAPAIVLAVAGAVVLLLAAIIGSNRRR